MAAQGASRASHAVRLAGYVQADCGGSVLSGALCFGDFDGDGEDEIAVGTATGRLALFKYNATALGPQVQRAPALIVRRCARWSVSSM